MRPRLLLPVLPAAALAVALAAALSGCTGAETAGRPAAGTPAPVDLPVPDGPYAVGYVPWPEAGPGVSVRYPAEPDTTLPVPPYLPDDVSSALGVPADQVAQVRGTSREGAVPAGTDLRRVVVLMPGFGAPIELSTGLAEHLASHGYAVVSVATDVAVEAGSDSGPDDGLREARARRLDDVLDALVDPARAERLAVATGPVDPTRIAVGGHSYAGSIAFNAALADDRITAVFDLDGSLLDAARQTPVAVPALMLVTERGVRLDGETRDVVERTGTAVAVGLADSGHYDVTDAPLLTGAIARTSELELGGVGPAAAGVTNALVLRFLEAALDEEPRTPAARDLVDGLDLATAEPW